MPGIHTHLNLAQRFLEKTALDAPGAFLLGNAYPDCFGQSLQRSVRLHYKRDICDNCDLSAFLKAEGRDDFCLGYYFHLWVDNAIRAVDVGDISKEDCLICDMDVIGPAIRAAKDHAVTEKEHQALGNILELEAKAKPLYLVPGEKKRAYGKILDALVYNFVSTEYKKWRRDHVS